jgi:predicted N-formylglutamate amidohydrolase
MKISAKRSHSTSRSRLETLVSCEHGGNRVPVEYARLFRGARKILESHRGMDFGALEIAEALGRRLRTKPITATTTRLLVDLNRSLHHRAIFSDYSRVLSPTERADVLAKYYLPYRSRVEREVERALADDRGLLVHVAAHSFTAALKGERRNCDIGFLYDPGRALERRFIDAWHAELHAQAPTLRVRRNYPYRGTSDALVTHLRRRHGARYAGVELEVNQRHVGSKRWPKLIVAVTESLAAALARIERL